MNFPTARKLQLDLAKTYLSDTIHSAVLIFFIFLPSPTLCKTEIKEKQQNQTAPPSADILQRASFQPLSAAVTHTYMFSR